MHGITTRHSAMTVEPLTVTPALIDQVHDRLLAAIIDGDLAPGERLTQESVAERLGVSRQPVSHALQALKRRGLLVEHGKRGLAVASIDSGRIIGLYQVREALDGLAARLAAERVRDGLVTARERAALEALITRGLAFTPRTSITTRIDIDVAFHSAIHRLSGNAAITEIVAEQWPHFMRSMAVVLRNGAIRDRVWSEHAAIASAVLAGDGDRGEAMARSHTSQSGIATARRLAEQN
jgi:DNA-binding GntR family transcriptional regulator